MILRVWILILLIKLWLSSKVPLFADEAYYWVWSKHLSFSYFDHPGFVAWLIKAGSFFGDSFLAVRWTFIIVGHLSILVWLKLFKPHLTEKQTWLAFLLLNFNFVTGWGTTLAVPDTPLMLFWPLAIFAMLKSLETKKWTWYSALGIFCGLGFCSKYHMSLFLPSALIWLSVEKKWAQIRVNYLFLTFLTFLVFASPVFYWNYLHEWASFKFQLTRGLTQGFQPKWVLDYIGSQVALIFPTVLIFAFFATRRNMRNSSLSWAVYFGWFPLVLFMYSSFKGRVEPNWTCIAIPLLLLLALSVDSSHKWLKATAVLWISCVVLIASQSIAHWLPIDEKKMKTYEFNASDAFLDLPQSYSPFYASSYQTASMLTYKTGINVYKLNGTHRVDHFDFMLESKPHTDEFYVLLGTWNQMPDWLGEYEMSVIQDYYPQEEFRLLHFKKK